MNKKNFMMVLSILLKKDDDGNYVAYYDNDKTYYFEELFYNFEPYIYFNWTVINKTFSTKWVWDVFKIAISTNKN